MGDPFKDTSGPSLNILLKLMSVVALVIAPSIAITVDTPAASSGEEVEKIITITESEEAMENVEKSRRRLKRHLMYYLILS